MKNSPIPYVLFFSIFLWNCANDRDDITTNISDSGLTGTWNLISVTGGFVGIDNTFETGLITWVFNEAEKQVVINNNNTDDNIYDVFPSGTYRYRINIKNEIKEFIIDDPVNEINDINLGDFILTNNEFTINQRPRDGFLVRFTR